jgi:hypothetical protein
VAEINDLSVTDASNTARFPEGMARASVNNAARALEGMIARKDKDNNGSLVTAGSSTVYTITLNSQHAAWFDGLTFEARLDETCGATPTINPTGSVALGAKTMVHNDGTAIAAGELIATGVYRFCYKSGTDRVHVTNSSAPVAAASEIVAGKVELATQAEVNTGSDTARAITPAGLTGWTPSVGTVTIVATDKLLLADASASGVLKQGLVSDIAAAIPATKIVAGTNLEKAPMAASSVTTQAHGLAGEPKFCQVILECTTADNAWDVGDRIDITGGGWGDSNSASDLQITLQVDATNVYLHIGAGTAGVLFKICDEDATAAIFITLASWKMVVTPYYWA